jgi:hypothetical protein
MNNRQKAAMGGISLGTAAATVVAFATLAAQLGFVRQQEINELENRVIVAETQTEMLRLILEARER